MKKLIYIITGLAIVLTGCETMPHADFAVSNLVVNVGEDVNFYNNSVNAVDFEWDFGDGYVAYRDNPIHRYYAPGVYEVRLSAFYEDHVDYAYTTIEVIEVPPTTLSIQVLEYYNQYPVEDASIIVYPTYNDWLNQTNMIIEVLTDFDGIAIIDGLEPATYYLDVWHETHDNYALADEDIDFIRVSGLQYGKITYFTAWVDYVPPIKSAKKERTRRKSTNETKREYPIDK